ncbi:MAG: hypothetical protein KGQ42_04495 [Alphaproteobacteria bacterium]|nr:hypothetical protein [Alphaproteobacteria bacterium]MDE2340508.1 hypothetical protein [Alphaproteobacteria bacterium]
MVQIAANQGGTLNETIAVTVNGVNYKPTALNQSGFTNDNWTPLTISAARLLSGATGAASFTYTVVCTKPGRHLYSARRWRHCPCSALSWRRF